MLQEGGATYIGTEYGLFRLNKNDDFYQYTSYPAAWLNRYGGYLIFAEYLSNYREGIAIRAFEFSPRTEPYPTEMLYDGAASYVQVDESGGWMYFLGDGTLWRESLAPLASSGAAQFKPEAIGWSSPASAGGDAIPLPHDAPQIPALTPDGIYALISMSGNRYEEFVYRYSFDGSTAGRVDELTDIACRGMFWYQEANVLLFRHDAQDYGSARGDELSKTGGIYAYAPGSGKTAQLHSDGGSDFTVYYDAGRAFPHRLVVAGGTRNGSPAGLVTIDISGDTPGEPKRLYDGAAMMPNIAGGYIYFRAPAGREGALYDYYRVPADGSSRAQRLDFVKRTIE